MGIIRSEFSKLYRRYEVCDRNKNMMPGSLFYISHLNHTLNPPACENNSEANYVSANVVLTRMGKKGKKRLEMSATDLCMFDAGESLTKRFARDHNTQRVLNVSRRRMNVMKLSPLNFLAWACAKVQHLVTIYQNYTNIVWSKRFGNNSPIVVMNSVLEKWMQDHIDTEQTYASSMFRDAFVKNVTEAELLVAHPIMIERHAILEKELLSIVYLICLKAIGEIDDSPYDLDSLSESYYSIRGEMRTNLNNILIREKKMSYNKEKIMHEDDVGHAFSHASETIINPVHPHRRISEAIVGPRNSHANAYKTLALAMKETHLPIDLVMKNVEALSKFLRKLMKNERLSYKILNLVANRDSKSFEKTIVRYAIAKGYGYAEEKLKSRDGKNKKVKTTMPEFKDMMYYNNEYSNTTSTST